MSYTPPAGNAADFAFGGAAYTPPAGNGADFNFGAVAGAELAASSTLSFATTAPLTTALELVAAATIALTAAPALLTTAISLSAAAQTVVFGTASDLTVPQAIDLAATATIVFGASAFLDADQVPIEPDGPDLGAGGAAASDYRRGGKRISLDLDLDRRRKRRRRKGHVDVVEPSRTDELGAIAMDRALPGRMKPTAEAVMAHNRTAIAAVLNALEDW